MDTESLRLFVKVAESLSISAAGRKLGLSPAIASARLSKLENQLGTDLLHRSTRKVSLSTEGEGFLPYAREILVQQDAAIAAIGTEINEVKGVLRFTASNTFAQLYILPVLPEFLVMYPELDLELKLSDTQVNVIEHGIDLALRNTEVKDSGLRARKLADDHRILCASPAYISKYGSPQTPESLAEHQLIVFKDAKGRKLTRTENNEENGSVFPPSNARVRLSCDDGTSMKIATLAGTGISMNSYWSVAHEIRQGDLVHILPEYHIDDQTAIWLVYPKANALSAKVRVFIDFLVEKIGEPAIWNR
ncbi:MULTISPECIES: LysR family transcriptional regulator [Shewanella]|uniref:LysR family transcriptional regulator n=1 Tax=Shewanella TaxID=22 RepID=UPI001BC27A70|nr:MULTISPECIES: LysR family transcriptional regulator [Shewanella]GIU53990.1 LysR family transcriptional regulator [Shewanella sp. KT0246]